MADVLWHDFERPNYGIIRGGLAGQSADMPPELHLKKLEQTPMYERESQLDDFLRSTLKDTTPDQASLAQDLPRQSQNTLRSEVLNIRHSAARTPAEPVHPDLFLGFTERDTRGYHNAGPDMRKYKKQSQARGKFKDFVSDHGSDWTIPEGTRSELRHIRDLRQTINASKERFKIFDTSRDSRASRHHSIKTDKSDIPKILHDGTILNLNDAQESHQRSDNTKLREDIIKVGYRQTSDLRFKVAQYGLTSAKQRRSNIHSTQHKGKVSHKFDVSPSEIKNRLMINILKEVGRRSYLDNYRHETASSFQTSMSTKNQIGRLLADLNTAQQAALQSADTIDLGYANQNITKVRVYDPVSHDSVVVDKDIFDKINEHKNIKFVTKTDLLARRDVLAEEGKKHLPGDQVEVYIYSNKAPDLPTHAETQMEHNWYDSLFEPIYKMNHTKIKNLNANFTEAEQGVNHQTDKVFDRYSKASGYSQGIRKDIGGHENQDPINDTEGFFTRSARGRTQTKQF